MALHHVEGKGNDLQICRIAADVLKEHTRTVEEGWSSNLEVEKLACYYWNTAPRTQTRYLDKEVGYMSADWIHLTRS
jgi:hypothetical protein